MFYQIKYEGNLIAPPIYRHSSLICGSDLIIFGGVDKDNRKYNELLCLNIRTKLWRIIIPGGVYPCSRTYHQMIMNKDKLYIIGK